jgi:hypothetical protein
MKAKQKHGKNENQNTDLFINCIDFVVVRTKIKKYKIVIFFVMLGPRLSSINLMKSKQKKANLKNKKFRPNLYGKKIKACCILPKTPPKYPKKGVLFLNILQLRKFCKKFC